jgi:hypothetical protein
MMAATVMADDCAGFARGTIAHTSRIMLNRQRFMAVFTTNPAKRMLTAEQWDEIGF